MLGSIYSLLYVEGSQELWAGDYNQWKYAHIRFSSSHFRLFEYCTIKWICLIAFHFLHFSLLESLKGAGSPCPLLHMQIGTYRYCTLRRSYSFRCLGRLFPYTCASLSILRCFWCYWSLYIYYIYIYIYIHYRLTSSSGSWENVG